MQWIRCHIVNARKPYEWIKSLTLLRPTESISGRLQTTYLSLMDISYVVHLDCRRLM